MPKKKPLFSKEEIEKINSTKLNSSRAKDFFHCKNCLEPFLNSPLKNFMTPREYGMYEISSYEFTYPNGKKVDIVVVWCKRCGAVIWDSRHLSNIY